MLKKAYGLTLLGFMVFGLSACDLLNKEKAPQAPQTQPAARVGVLPIVPMTVGIYSEMPGRTVAFETAEVRPEVTGIIKERVFEEGSYVEKGDILYLIDDETYKANYASAKANLSRAQAALNVAALKEKRMSALRKKNAISQQDYDDSRATYLQARAEVAAADAAEDLAKINLERTEIRAQISGMISKSSVSLGTLVTSNQANPMATIYQINPMNVDLTQSVSALIAVNQQVSNKETKDNLDFSKLDYQTELFLNNNIEYNQIGRLVFADVGVNLSTATVGLRAEFPNPNNALMPGLFIRAKVKFGEKENAILVPQRAVLRNQKNEPFVFVAEGLDANNISTDPKNPSMAKAVRHPIVIGETYETSWLVKEGLEVGDSIIITGVQNVTDGGPIAVVKIEEENVPTDATIARIDDGGLSSKEAEEMEKQAPDFSDVAVEEQTSTKASKN